jgi:predicted amidohydrolase
MAQVVKIAGVQMEPKLLEKERNLEECLEKTYLAAKEGARLVVFPECALSGYVFSSLQEALPAAEPIPGPSTERILSACRELNVYVVLGLLERDGDRCYNAAVLLGPQGLVGKHRKAHLPDLGVDRFVHLGDLPFTVYDTEVGKIGMAICFESCFPEHIRALALQGAEIVVLPTNWPDWPSVRVIRDLLVPARAAENFIFFVAVDRVGQEGEVTFMGGSRVAGIGGVILAEARGHEQDIIYADIDLAETQEKMGLLSKRRPDLYGLVAREMNHEAL